MAQPLRLLWVFPSFSCGGAQKRFVELAGALSGYTHHVVALDGNMQAASLLSPDAPVVLHPLKARASGGISLRNLRVFHALQTHIAPDILLTHNWGSLEWHLVNRGRKAAPVIHFEDGFAHDELPSRQKWRRVLARRILFRAPFMHFVAPSRDIARCFREVWRAGTARVWRIPNGVNLQRFAPLPRMTGLRSPLTIGAVGALRAEKRFDRLIEAFSCVLRTRECRLLLVGDGPERDALSALAAKRGVAMQIEMTGYREDIRPMLGKMDIFAISSDTEQMPVSLLEAMAAHLPVVASAVGEMAATLPKEQAPFLSPVAEGAAGLARRIEALLDAPALRLTLGRANARRAKRFDRGRMLKCYDALFCIAASSRVAAPFRIVSEDARACAAADPWQGECAAGETL